MMEPPRIPAGSALGKGERGERLERIEHPLNPRLGRMRFLSRLLDNSIPLPGGYRIGLDPIIGLIPGIGDVVASSLSIWLIYEAACLGVRKRILAKMAWNVILEAAVGSVPVVGDVVDAAWKANARNMRLVEAHYIPGSKERSPRQFIWFVLALLLAIYGVLFLALYVAFRVIAAALSWAGII